MPPGSGGWWWKSRRWARPSFCNLSPTSLLRYYSDRSNPSASRLAAGLSHVEGAALSRLRPALKKRGNLPSLYLWDGAGVLPDAANAFGKGSLPEHLVREELRKFFFFLEVIKVEMKGQKETGTDGGRRLGVFRSRHDCMMKIRPYRVTLS